MGSSLSIVNDTPDPWMCKLSHDEKALGIAMWVVSIVSLVVPVIGAAAASATITTAVAANGVIQVLGVSSRVVQGVALASRAIGPAIRIADKASSFTLELAQAAIDRLEKENYHYIEPGSKHTWGKLTLSLWQQGTCVKTTVIDEFTMRTETLYMRPIFSGATDKSNLDHSIKWWLENKGDKESQDTTVTDPIAEGGGEESPTPSATPLPSARPSPSSTPTSSVVDPNKGSGSVENGASEETEETKETEETEEAEKTGSTAESEGEGDDANTDGSGDELTDVNEEQTGEGSDGVAPDEDASESGAETEDEASSGGGEEISSGEEESKLDEGESQATDESAATDETESEAADGNSSGDENTATIDDPDERGMPEDDEEAVGDETVSSSDGEIEDPSENETLASSDEE